MGASGMRPQMKYADRRASPAVVIVGGDEVAQGHGHDQGPRDGRAEGARPSPPTRNTAKPARARSKCRAPRWLRPCARSSRRSDEPRRPGGGRARGVRSRRRHADRSGLCSAGGHSAGTLRRSCARAPLRVHRQSRRRNGDAAGPDAARGAARGARGSGRRPFGEDVHLCRAALSACRRRRTIRSSSRRSASSALATRQIPSADAELFALVHRAVEACGVSPKSIVTGDLAIFPAFIDALGLPAVTTDLLKRAFRQEGGVRAVLDAASRPLDADILAALDCV